MEELESIAFSKVQRCSLAWDFQHLGVFNADMSPYMERREAECDDYHHKQQQQHSFVEEDECDHFSTTGYLQDVLLEFSSNSKRRRLSHSHTHTHTHSSIQSCWTSDLITLTENTKLDTISGELEPNSDSSSISISSQTQHNQCTPEKANLYCIEPIFSSSSGGSDNKRKKRVVYPFALVKPGGFEGDATLNDINRRILMPPTRPVRHPVGDFACRPLVSPDGPGLSGKAVVAFTRIHTQGRGTITIIRTRG